MELSHRFLQLHSPTMSSHAGKFKTEVGSCCPACDAAQMYSGCKRWIQLGPQCLFHRIIESQNGLSWE